jgi:Adenylosuccinate lyase C-terminus
MSEPVMMALGHKLGRQMAHELVYEICMDAFTQDELLRHALLKNSKIASRISGTKLDAMLDPSSYLGMAQTFVDRVPASFDQLPAKYARTAPGRISQRTNGKRRRSRTDAFISGRTTARRRSRRPLTSRSLSGTGVNFLLGRLGPPHRQANIAA